MMGKVVSGKGFKKEKLLINSHIRVSPGLPMIHKYKEMI